MDREKVIKGIHQHCEGSLFDRCGECPYYEMDFESWGESKFKCRDALLMDALVLLKEQEAVKPTLIREGRNKHYNDYVCPRCDNEVVYEQNYCSECGVRFLWGRSVK